MDSYVTRSGGAFVKLSSRSPKDAALSSDALKILLKEGVCLPVCVVVCVMCGMCGGVCMDVCMLCVCICVVSRIVVLG